MTEGVDRAPRRMVRLTGNVRLGQAAPVTAVCTDISTTGMALRLVRSGLSALPVERTPVLATIQLRRAAIHVLRISGEVVRAEWDPVQRGTALLGVRFGQLSAADSKALQGFLSEWHPSVLVIDSDRSLSEVYRGLEPDFRVLLTGSVEQALGVVEGEDVRAVVIEPSHLQQSWTAAVDRIAARMPEAFFARILVSEITVAAPEQDLVSAGLLFAIVRKPFSASQLSQVVRRAVTAMEVREENRRLQGELDRANRRLEQENALLRQRLEGSRGFEGLIGSSASLKASLSELERVRKTDISVHLHGETGTGKELAARALHHGGSRAKGAFVAQNCAGLSETLLHSTLFGHVRGAFTGADRDHAGVFQQADGGTLFLDEVADMPLPLQTSLLRALQEHEVTPLGATRAQKVDVRIVSATHRDVREEVRAGRFREDLYFRLAVMTVRLPPLRERKDDIALLARHFLDLHCERHARDVRGFTVEAMRALEASPWPGNVRELENEIERAVVMAPLDARRIGLELLSSRLADAQPKGPVTPRGHAATDGLVRVPLDVGYDEAIEQLSRALIESALDDSAGVVARAAQKLGIERTRLSKLRARLSAGKGSQP